MQIQENTLKKLKKFEHLFQHGHKSDRIDNTLGKLAEIELFEFKKNLKELASKTSRFEKQYHMSSKEFLAGFNSGELGDSADFVEWFAYADMTIELLKKIAILEKTDR